MVVTCPKCSTGYEFDETLIGSKGTVVRCTQCSHMFKIFADESDTSLEHAGWMIRKTNGKVFGIDSCTDPSCPRAYPHSVAEHDAKSDKLCDKCRKALNKAFGLKQ